MDHLQTSEERKARWYSKVWPRYARVVASERCNDVLAQEGLNSPSDEQPIVYSLTMDTIRHDHGGQLLRQVLEKHGFVVISGLLDAQECSKALELAQDWFDAATFAEKQDLPEALEGGMMPFYGSFHSTFAWYVRSRPQLAQVFEAFYGTSELLASLDGIVLWPKSRRTKTDAGWFHVDQNPETKPGFCSLQGLVNLLPTTPETGGNAIVRGSHKLFPDHYLSNDHQPSCFYTDRLKELDGDDWMEVDPLDHVLLKPNDVITCLLNAGDFLLWDSRTVHCSFPSRQDHDHQNSGGAKDSQRMHPWIRAATTITMMPKKEVSPRVLELRRDSVSTFRTQTHWVNKARSLGEERPIAVEKEQGRINDILNWQTITKKRVLLDYDQLDSCQRALVDGND